MAYDGPLVFDGGRRVALEDVVVPWAVSLWCRVVGVADPKRPPTPPAPPTTTATAAPAPAPSARAATAAAKPKARKPMQFPQL